MAPGTADGYLRGPLACRKGLAGPESRARMDARDPPRRGEAAQRQLVARAAAMMMRVTAPGWEIRDRCPALISLM